MRDEKVESMGQAETEDFVLTLILTLLNNFEKGIAEVKSEIAKRKGVRIWSWNPRNIKWVKTEGFKGLIQLKMRRLNQHRITRPYLQI